MTTWRKVFGHQGMSSTVDFPSAANISEKCGL